jgi:signal transduction histidine kinase
LIRVKDGKFSVVAGSETFAGGVGIILREAPGVLWIGTREGLHRWSEGKSETWNEKNGLVPAAVRALYRDREGTLWIGTNGGGIGRLKNGRVGMITTANGLRDDNVSQIISDDFGCLWLGSNQGIMRVRVSEMNAVADGGSGGTRAGAVVHPLLFAEGDGMLDAQCVGGEHACTRTRDGRLLFCTIAGIVEMNPRDWVEPSSMPVAIIDEVLVDGVAVPREKGGGSKFGGKGGAGGVVLPPTHRSLEVRFSGLSLPQADSTTFRVRLEGQSSDWVELGTRRSVSYSALPPRSYLMSIEACDGDGNWNPRVASLPVVVRPFWWQTEWFRAIAVVTVVGVCVLVYLRRRNARRRSEAVRRAYTNELIRSQEVERKRIASELHDSLGQDLLLIKNRLMMLEPSVAGSPEASAQIRQISASASQAIQNVRAISHGLRPSAIEQVGLIGAVEWMIAEVRQTTPAMLIETDLDDIDGVLDADLEMNLFRIIQEAINNVMKHSKASRVILELKRGPETIELSVYDDGCGFNPDLTLGDGSSKPAFGLFGLTQRAALLGGTLDIRSSPGKGTRLSVSIPVRVNERGRS